MNVAGHTGYKESDIGWIPEEWESIPLGHIAAIRKDKNFAVHGKKCIELEHLESETGRIIGWDDSGTQASIKTTFSRGDVLFGKLRPYLRKFAIVPFDGVCTTEILAIYPKDGRVLGRFLFYLMQGDEISDIVTSLSYGTKMPRVSWSDLSDVTVITPPLLEQQKIVAILSAVDDKLDVITRQIATTQTLKQGLMQTLFNQGTSTPKESKWPKVPLHEIADVRTGIAKGKKGLKDPVQLPYLRVANVQDGHIDLSEVKTIKIESSQVQRYALNAGDVLMTEGGDFNKLGRGDVWDARISPCLHQNHVFAVRPNPEKLDSYYLAALAASAYGRRYFLSCAKRTTNLASINSSQLKAFPVIHPPMEEQRRIAAIVDATNAKIGILEAKQAHYQSLKRGLMQKLLTGEWRVKLDDVAIAA